MPPLNQHQSGETTKMIFIGDPGAGKSGALASLAAAGYNLRILDFDNGLDVLRNLLMGAKGFASPYAEGSVNRVEFITLTDKMKPVAGKLIPVAATVWSRMIKLLENWTDGETKLGSILSWTPQDVLVIDSLTMLSNAALAFILSINGRLGQQPHQSDWYHGQQLIESLLQTLYDENVKCNVIVNCHLTYIGEEGGPQRAYPNCLGKALPPKVGRYFNSALLAQSTGSGNAMKRRIFTNTRGMIELKNTAPLSVKPEYPIETGLAEYFAAVRGV